jgi:hypothetical protein
LLLLFKKCDTIICEICFSARLLGNKNKRCSCVLRSVFEIIYWNYKTEHGSEVCKKNAVSIRENARKTDCRMVCFARIGEIDFEKNRLQQYLIPPKKRVNTV